MFCDLQVPDETTQPSTFSLVVIVVPVVVAVVIIVAIIAIVGGVIIAYVGIYTHCVYSTIVCVMLHIE